MKTKKGTISIKLRDNRNKKLGGSYADRKRDCFSKVKR